MSATENIRANLALDMVELMVDNFLPDPDTCDETAFANCLVDSGF